MKDISQARTIAEAVIEGLLDGTVAKRGPEYWQVSDMCVSATSYTEKGLIKVYVERLDWTRRGDMYNVVIVRTFRVEEDFRAVQMTFDLVVGTHRMSDIDKFTSLFREVYGVE